MSLSLSKEARSIEGFVFSSIFPTLGGMGVDGEAQVFSRGGVDYLVSCHGVKRGQGRWQTKIYAFQDISALAAIKREVEEARAKAEAANAAKSAFIATLSHELRNPLNAILGLADLNLRSGASAEMRDDLEAILSSGTIILGLVNDLLDLSKIEAGKIDINNSPANLRELLDLILTDARNYARAKRKDYTARCDYAHGGAAPSDEGIPLKSLDHERIAARKLSIDLAGLGKPLRLHFECNPA